MENAVQEMDVRLSLVERHVICAGVAIKDLSLAGKRARTL
jgi:hypothetical protein